MKTKLTKKLREVLELMEAGAACCITMAQTHELSKLGLIAFEPFGDGTYEKAVLTPAGRELLKKGKGE